MNDDGNYKSEDQFSDMKFNSYSTQDSISALRDSQQFDFPDSFDSKSIEERIEEYLTQILRVKTMTDP